MSFPKIQKSPSTFDGPNTSPLDLGFEEHLNIILRKESSREDCMKVISTWKERRM